VTASDGVTRQRMEIRVIAIQATGGEIVHILNQMPTSLVCGAEPPECLAVLQHRAELATCPACVSAHAQDLAA
jgi:hypothetical protein